MEGIATALENDTPVTGDDLLRLRGMYEAARFGKLEDLVSGWGGSLDDFYWSNCPVYTLLRRIYLPNPMLGPFPVPGTLGEVGAFMERWHYPLLQMDICQEDPGKSKADAIFAATCGKEDLPLVMAVDEGRRDSAPLPGAVLADLYNTMLVGGALPSWYQDTGRTPDAWIIAMWRMELGI